MRRIGQTLMFLAACMVATLAQGHAISTNYLSIEDRGESAVTATWDLGAADLHWALQLDSNADGRVTWGEVEEHRAAIENLAVSSLTITRGGSGCPVHLRDLLMTHHAGEPSI